MRWKPKNLEKYWFVTPDGNVTWEYYSLVDLFNCGNCFRTKKEAQQAAKLVKKTLMEFHRRKG